MAEHSGIMDTIEQYQARIDAALKTATHIAGKLHGGGGANLRERDLAVIEELEATLAEERADLQMERESVASLQSRANEAQQELLAAQEARASTEDALESAENARRVALESLAAQKTQMVAEGDPAQDAHIERLNARIESQDVQFQRLRAANAQLRESIGILRERNTAMLGDSDAIDQAMRAELEALHSTRAADIDEMNTILDELKPLVEGQVNA